MRIYSELTSIFKDIQHRYKHQNDEIDIFLPSLKVGIEVDGSYWHKDKLIKDREKTERLKIAGIEIIRVREFGLKKISDQDILIEKNPDLLDACKKIAVYLLTLNPSSEIKSYLKDYLSNNKFVGDELFKEKSTFLLNPQIENSLNFKYPSVAKEWHPTKNKNITPAIVYATSGRKFWWRCTYDHEWEASVASRTSSGTGCPFCAGQKPTNINNLLISNPSLATEWHYSKNIELKPDQVTPASTKKVWWQCKQGHEWLETVAARNKKRFGCPYCSGRRASSNNNNISVLHPNLIKEWLYEKNDKSPLDITSGSEYKAWWKCGKGHEWNAMVFNRVRGKGCPVCNRMTKTINKKRI